MWGSCTEVTEVRDDLTEWQNWQEALMGSSFSWFYSSTPGCVNETTICLDRIPG